MPARLCSRARRAAASLAAALIVGLPAVAWAHDPGLSSLDVRIAPTRIVATLSLALADAGLASPESSQGLERFAVEAIELTLDGRRLAGEAERVTVDDTGVQATVVFSRPAGSRLAVRSLVPLRLSRGHRELLTVREDGGGAITERMLDAEAPATELRLGEATGSGSIAGQFLALGVHHILGGYDHLLFLGALLLGVCRLRSVASVVTAFTIAHSLTLSLAVLGIIRVPAAVVEPIIAASIVFVGIENLWRGQMDSRWLLTFAFGLVHGFGFAGALEELGVGGSGSGIAVPLGCFNLGVEAGQLAVATLLWPLLRQLNARPALRARLAPACSLLVVAAGAYWIVERTVL